VTVVSSPRASKLDLELELLRLRLRRRILWLRSWWGSDPLHGVGALLASDSRVDALARRPDPEDEAAFYADDDEAARIDEALAELQTELDAAPRSPFDSLVEFFRLTRIDRELIALALAPEIDPGFERLYAYAQDDASRRFATPQLAVDLFGYEARLRLVAKAPLRRLRLLTLEAAPEFGWSGRPLRADERILDLARGIDHVDERLAAAAMRVDDPPPVGAHAELADRLAAYLAACDSLPLVHLQGPRVAGARSIASAACERIGLTLASISPGALASEPGLTAILDREAVLLRLAYYVEDDGTAETHAPLEQLSAPVFVGGERRLELDVPTVTVTVEPLVAADQRALWASVVETLAPEETDRLVEQFDLGPRDIAAAARRAEARAALCGRTEGADLEDVWAACREQSRFQADGLARHLVPASRWEELVLPQDALSQLEEIAAQASNRRVVYEDWGFGPRLTRGRGITALFAGPSGTGKTMAAEVLAERLRLDLLSIDLAGLLSRWLGQTEKNLRSIFDAAESSGAILFFDEADALFSKRTEVKDAHARYANIEVDYLLQRMEEYRGLAILATNRRSLLDPAFLRRLRFVIEFPFPDAEVRERLWRMAFPPQTPVGELDFEALARLEVAGGSIKTIALNAAFLAASRQEPVGMDHVMPAARREYTKLERLIAPNEFGGWV
jgi:ATPase family associated with various cellular activities (AAA)/Winged helix domain, variant